MDEQRFDQLTRSLARGASRRGVLKGLVGVLGGALGFGTVSTAEARARNPNGTDCSSPRDCASGLCVDGVCCDAACISTCEACNIAGSEGTCSPVQGVPVGNRGPCPGDGSVCSSSCDGITTTHCAGVPGSETVCGDAACAEGMVTGGVCSGNGLCIDTTQSCGLYACAPDGGGCLTSCAGNGDCVGDAFCVEGVCQGDLALGAVCDGADQCQSGQCVDDVCCDSACDGACQSCGADGFCADDANDADCDGGVCCRGDCVSLDTDANCAACGDACVNGETCDGGACVIPCEEGFRPCDGLCIRESDCCFDEECPDPEHGAGVCDHRDCAVTCEMGYRRCGRDTCIPDGDCCTADECQPPSGDEVCQAAAICVNGECGFDSAPSNTVCRPAGCENGEAIAEAVCGGATTCPPAETTTCLTGACNGTICVPSCESCDVGESCVDGDCVSAIMGELTDDGRHIVSCDDAFAYPATLYTLVHPGGPITIGLRGANSIGSDTLVNPRLELHQYPYKAGDPCASQIDTDNNGGCNRDALLTLSDLDAGVYHVVASSAYSEVTGTYTLTFGEDAAC